MPGVPGGRPARPAGRPSPAVAAGPRRRSPPGTPRPLLPAFPCGRAGPPARPCPAAGPAHVSVGAPASSSLLAPRGGGRGRAGRAGAGAGLDGGGRSGASVVADPRTGRPRERAPLPAGPPPPRTQDPGPPDDPLLTIEEVTAELRVSRAAFYRWRRLGAGPAVVRLPGGGVRVRRSALTEWLRRLEADTQDGQEQTADGQLRRQVLGHQEARQRQRRPVPGPVGRRRPRALQVVQGPAPRRRVPRPTSRTRSATGGPSARAPACPTPRRPGAR